MEFYFQPPIFINVPLVYTPILIATPIYRPSPRTKLKVIFHRQGTVLASNDAVYDHKPTRETLLGNLSYWSEQHGLRDRVYAGQVSLYLTGSAFSTLVVLPGIGPVRPDHAERVVSLGELLCPREFREVMLQIGMRQLGAFLTVDVAAFDRIDEEHRQQSQGNDQTIPEQNVTPRNPDSHITASNDSAVPSPPPSQAPVPDPDDTEEAPVPDPDDTEEAPVPDPGDTEEASTQDPVPE